VDDNVLLFADPGAGSFFDDRTEAMDRVVHDAGTRALFYERQSEAAHHHLAGAAIILDVGCGGALQYPRPSGSRIIGVDLSRGLLRKNRSWTRLYAPQPAPGDRPLGGSGGVLLCGPSLRRRRWRRTAAWSSAVL
jgi:hypothetical protein